MNKISIINLGGRVISIEHNASQIYTAYIETLYHYFINEEGWPEIMNDIENRAAELMQDTINTYNTCINKADIENIIRVMGTADEFKELDNDDWDICTISPACATAGNGISPIRPVYELTEKTFMQLEEFKLCSN
jgi:hypothetical protein